MRVAFILGSALLGALPVLALGCHPPGSAGKAGDPPAGPPWFEDVTAARGLHFVHGPGPVPSTFMPQVMGSGYALLDYDGDGRLDLYSAQNAGPESGATNCLYHQEPGGSFCYLASSDPRAPLGLGPAGRFDRLHVVWPDGSAEEFGGGEVNRILEVRKGQGAPARAEGRGS